MARDVVLRLQFKHDNIDATFVQHTSNLNQQIMTKCTGVGGPRTSNAVIKSDSLTAWRPCQYFSHLKYFSLSIIRKAFTDLIYCTLFIRMFQNNLTNLFVCAVLPVWCTAISRRHFQIRNALLKGC